MTVDPGAADAAAASPEPAPPGDTRPDAIGAADARSDGLWAERVGAGCYTGHNARGAQVRMGPIEAGDVFTPGELLKIALAGCAGMSADHPLARRLGEDAAVVVHVAGPKLARDERYPALHEELVVDLSGLDPDDRDRVTTIVRRAIDRYCTVGRTLKHAATVELTISDPPPSVAPFSVSSAVAV